MPVRTTIKILSNPAFTSNLRACPTGANKKPTLPHRKAGEWALEGAADTLSTRLRRNAPERRRTTCYSPADLIRT